MNNLGFLCLFYHLYQVILPSPVLNEGELESLLKDPLLKPQVLSTFFDIRKGVEGSLEKTLYKLCEAADEAVRNGSQLLVLSDRADELVSFLLLPLCIHKYNFLYFLSPQTYLELINAVRINLCFFILSFSCLFVTQYLTYCFL